MKFNFSFYLLIILITVPLTSFQVSTNKYYENNQELLNKIFNAIDNLKTLRYNLQCNERIRGRLQHTESKVKLQVSPRKLYLNIREIEVLWMEGMNNGNALVNPGSFPYINLNLDPAGSLMRKDQHHTIHEMGYVYLADIIKHGLRNTTTISNNFRVLGEEIYDNRACYKIALSFPDFKWIPYTVQKNENLISIARKLRISEYMVLEKNTNISGYNNVREGQIIQVPTSYAKLTLLLIDKEHLLPVNNKIFDDNGVFETYEYHNLQVNSFINPEEFTKKYKDYKF
ncbi:MAG: DUF1571 domain-containing protein [Bacteroidia bacterium]